ncbi:MAG: CDP-alcohol phosphatidyltransferase family protein [Pseudomonadales bacterium]
MIDHQFRKLIDPPLDKLAQALHQSNITANQVTIAGFMLGMSVIPLLAFHQFMITLLVIIINRLADGLDGAIARNRGVTDAGGYLDIVLDFIFYSAVIFGFCLALPEQAVYGAFLIFSFIGTGSSFLTLSIFAAKRSLTTKRRGMKSIYYLGGLTEGFETIVCLILMCLVPDWFWLIASIFGILCWVTTLSRIITSVKLLDSTGD